MADTTHSSPPLIAVVGPTASGKSGVAIELARRLDGEIVSVDSLQVYRHFDIGTGKVTLEEQQQAPHHLIDVIEPNQNYNAADFQKDADRAIAKISSRKKPVILAGGTGLYLRALLHGLFDTPSDETLRETLREEARQQGLETLYLRLKQIDPLAAEKISVNDPVRIVRALEVFELTGQPFSSLAKEHGHQDNRYRVMLVGLMLPRPLLYERIEQRIELMFQQGWTNEVGVLRKRGFGPELKPMQCIGYREINQMFDGELDPELVLPRVRKQTKAYAKRQLTWFRKEPVWWSASAQELLDDGALMREIERFLEDPTTAATPPDPQLLPRT